MIGSDPQGPAQSTTFLHQRGEALLDAFQLGGVVLVGVFAGGKLLRVRVVARIDPDLLHPLDRFHRRLGLEVDVGHDWDPASQGPKFPDHVLEVGRILHGRRGDPHDLATDRDQFQRLPDTGGGVHRVTGQHGLLDHRMGASHGDTAGGRVPDNDFTDGSA